MESISITDLKGRLSSAVAEAEAGSTIIITRHNQPVAQLSLVPRSPRTCTEASEWESDASSRR